MRYKTWRSWPEVELHLLCCEDGFKQLPQRIRALGPWTGSREGDVERLKPHYRRLLAEQAFVVVWVKPSALALES